MNYENFAQFLKTHACGRGQKTLAWPNCIHAAIHMHNIIIKFRSAIIRISIKKACM